MSSGGVRKKVVAAAAPSQFASLNNPDPPQTNTGGIKLLIEKNRIVKVPVSKAQTAEQREAVQDIRTESRIAPNETLLKGARTGSSSSINIGAERRKSVAASVLISTAAGIYSKGGGKGESEEMRLKTTDERNGQSSQASRLPLIPGWTRPNTFQQVKPAPTQRRQIVPSAPDDTANGQSVPVSNVQSHANACSYTAGITDMYSEPDMQLNKMQDLNDSAGLIMDVANSSASPVTSPDQTPNESVKDRIDSMVTDFCESMTQDGSFEGANPAEPNDKMVQTKLGNEKSIAKGSTAGMERAGLNKATNEEVVSKPSREIKLLQQMQSKSKILTEFIADTNKSKLRKRHSDSAADLESVNADSTVSIGATTSSRKRLRSKSTAYDTAMPDDHGAELTAGASFRLEDVEFKAPTAAGRRRKPRINTKSDYSLEKTSPNANDSLGSAKVGAREIVSSINLRNEETDDQSFPADPPKPGWDRFCWRCKRSNPELGCSICIRSYHEACVRYSVEDPNWSCTECKMSPKPRADVESVSKCLGIVLDLIAMDPEWNELFNPLDKSAMPHYDKYITRHMDLTVLQNNLAQRAYKAPEEFFADISWLVHNMTIYPNKMTLLKHARGMQKKVKYEFDEMEPCLECYTHTATHAQWFIEPCSKPHLLVWAKLKGYPFWPGKLYTISGNNQAYVRFFATQDRSLVPVKDCLLYSKQDPNPPKNVKNKQKVLLAKSVTDIELHITRLRERFNTFNYGKACEFVDPLRYEEQRRAMLPGAFLQKVKVTIKRSEGEMVAVASSSNDEIAARPNSNVRSEEGKEAAVVQPGAKVTTTTSPRKRMTRRMSRFLKNAEEGIETTLTNTDSSKDAATTPPNTLSNNDKGLVRNQATNKTVDDKIEQPNVAGCKNLSLLLRRGSQSWETEPLTKRRKSGIDKSVSLNASAAPKMQSTAVPSSNANETAKNVNKDCPKPAIHQETFVTPIDQKEATNLPSAVTITKAKTTGSNVKETTTTSVQKNFAQPVAEKASNVPSIAPVERHSPPAGNNLDSPYNTFAQHGAKQVTLATLASNHLNSTGTNDSVGSDLLTPMSLDSEAMPNNAQTETNIKQEKMTGDEVNAVKMSSDALPSKNMQEAARGQTKPTVSAENTVKSVQRAQSAVLAIDAASKAGGSNNTASTTVRSNQRARKSFPGGSINNGKNVTTKQAATLTPNVLVPISVLKSKNATVSIPKELVTPATMNSLIPGIENRKSDHTDVGAPSVANDNDDVMIIEDETAPSTTTVPSKERNMDESNLLPPPLVPKPQITTPAPSESMIELNNTTQLFDDSADMVLGNIRVVMQDLLKLMAGKGSSLAELAILKLNHERKYEEWLQEKQKLKNECERRMAELRTTLEQEKERALNKQRQKLVGEKERAVKDAKSKQWCIKCYNEAIYYCCWNTSYCSESCQQKHWKEHKHVCTQKHANNIRRNAQSAFATTGLIISPDNSASLPNRSSLNISIVPTGTADSNMLNQRSVTDMVGQSDIAATSTPLQAPIRLLPGTVASNVAYKTPIIQSVHGRDSVVIQLSSRTAQNGSNATGTANSPQQQKQQKKVTPRDKPIQLTNQKLVASPNRGYVPKKVFKNTSASYQVNNLPTATTSTYTPMGTTPSYVTLTEEVAGSNRPANNVWNQVPMMQTTVPNRQMHSGTPFTTPNRREGPEKGHKQNSPPVVSIVQQPKIVQQPSTTYMRHQQ